MDSMIEASIRAEAARYCDRHEVRDYASFQRIQAAIAFEQFRKAIEPYQHAITRIYLLRLLDHIVMREGELPEHVYRPLPVEAEQALTNIDEMIIAEVQRFGCDKALPPA